MAHGGRLTCINCAEFLHRMRCITIKCAHTWHYRRMRPCIDRSNGLAPLSSFPFWRDCIINRCGYDFRKGQVPLLVGDATPEEVAQVLSQLWDRPGTLIVVSSDLSHYHDYETARRLDAATAATIEHGDWASLGPQQACGSRAVAGLLLESARRGLKIRRLSLCNSGDTAGSRDRVVGYGAWMFAQTAA
jgi:hypothetical protein